MLEYLRDNSGRSSEGDNLLVYIGPVFCGFHFVLFLSLNVQHCFLILEHLISLGFSYFS